METTWQAMTVEHLGAEATAVDLAEFRAAAQKLVGEQGMTDQEATDWLWHNGDYAASVACTLGSGPVCIMCAERRALDAYLLCWPCTEAPARQAV